MAVSKVGTAFRSLEELDNSLKAYEKANDVVLTTYDSRKLPVEHPLSARLKYSKLVRACKHYGQKRANKKLTNARPNQRTFKIGCKMHISFELSGEVLVVKSIDESHIHVRDLELVKLYPENRRLTDEEAAATGLDKFLEFKVKASNIKQHLLEMTGKSVQVQDLSNYRYRLKQQLSGGAGKTEEALAELLKLTLDDPDAVVIIGRRPHLEPNHPVELLDIRLFFEGGEATGEYVLEFVYFQTGDMRKTFEEFPEVLLLDSTYNVTELKMPLSISMVMDGFGAGRGVSYCFVTNERATTIAAVLQCLKKANPTASPKVKVVIVDKDASEISAIREEFDSALIQLCEFHVLKALKEGTKDIPDKSINTRRTRDSRTPRRTDVGQNDPRLFFTPFGLIQMP